MFRNQYDTDVTTFSPAGRLHQVEYAMEAVKQGACTVGVKNAKFAVVASLKRSASELASYQPKVFKLSSHMGMGVSGLISDARVLAQWLRSELQQHEFVFDQPLQSERLVLALSDKSQVFTQKDEKRPYGVGLLVVGYDKTGAHLYQTEPSGVYFDCHAQAIGARSQSAKTYLEKVFNTFEGASLDTLVDHALQALKGASQKKLTSRNVAVGLVGEGQEFKILEGEAVRRFVAQVTNLDDKDEEEAKEEGDSENIPFQQAEIAQKRAAEDEEEKAAQSVADEQEREEIMDTRRE